MTKRDEMHLKSQCLWSNNPDRQRCKGQSRCRLQGAAHKAAMCLGRDIHMKWETLCGIALSIGLQSVRSLKNSLQFFNSIELMKAFMAPFFSRFLDLGSSFCLSHLRVRLTALRSTCSEVFQGVASQTTRDDHSNLALFMICLKWLDHKFIDIAHSKGMQS